MRNHNTRGLDTLSNTTIATTIAAATAVAILFFAACNAGHTDDSHSAPGDAVPAPTKRGSGTDSVATHPDSGSDRTRNDLAAGRSDLPPPSDQPSTSTTDQPHHDVTTPPTDRQSTNTTDMRMTPPPTDGGPHPTPYAEMCRGRGDGRG